MPLVSRLTSFTRFLAKSLAISVMQAKKAWWAKTLSALTSTFFCHAPAKLSTIRAQPPR
jgi:hypothetical protein